MELCPVLLFARVAVNVRVSDCNEKVVYVYIYIYVYIYTHTVIAIIAPDGDLAISGAFFRLVALRSPTLLPVGCIPACYRAQNNVHLLRLKLDSELV